MRSFETLAFYRGMSSDIPLDRPSLFRARKNRKPRDTPDNLHYAADEWFRNKFGIPYRSEALFVTSNRIIAQFYGKSPDHCVRIIPIDNYSYCWSSKYADFLHLAKNVSSAEDLTSRLNISEYVTSNLELAHSSGNELMLCCDFYLAIPIGLLGNSEMQIPTSNIIILS
jgi:hypothetical protein